jgi:hypothetical protein
MTGWDLVAKVSLTIFLLLAVAFYGAVPASAEGAALSPPPRATTTTNPAVSNFTAAIDRLVTLAAAAGGGLLSLVWARVALSWFSHDSMKKVLAKERARDALIGTLLFVGAISGLVWALANWVVTGT